MFEAEYGHSEGGNWVHFGGKRQKHEAPVPDLHDEEPLRHDDELKLAHILRYVILRLRCDTGLSFVDLPGFSYSTVDQSSEE